MRREQVLSKPITALLLYFTSGSEKCGITDVKAFREVFGNAHKWSENNFRFWCFGVNFITGQSFSKISSVIYISTYYLLYIKKQFWLCSSPLMENANADLNQAFRTCQTDG